MFVALVTCLVSAAASKTTVSGTVVDPSGEPLIGVAVAVVGNNTMGTTTDIDGNFTLADLPENTILRFSYVGYVSQEIKVDNRSHIDVTLSEDNQVLDEVVVIGYGSAKSKDLTAPITVVKGEDIAVTPTSSPMSALTGKVPGVNILNSGTPGESPKVQIRGIGSFSGSEPLYVVDGVFYDNIQFLNNDDIADMSILKDASSATSYGVKAANGVVIITTKHGRKNMPAKIRYNMYVGFSKATNVLKMANSHEYATMLMEANPDAYKSYLQASIDAYGGNMGDLTFGADTDWYDQLLRTGFVTNHGLTISGGSERATYSLGLNYLYQEGILNSDNSYDRLNFRAQVDYDATNWLKVGFNGVFGKSKQVLPNNAAWETAFNMPQIMPVMNTTENPSVFPEQYASPQALGFGSNFRNPVATADYYNSQNDTYQALTNFFAQFTILPEKLDFRTSYGYDFSSIKGKTVVEPYFVSTEQQVNTSSLTKSRTQYNKWVWDNVLTYKDRVGKHSFGAMVGYSMRQDSYDFLEGTVNGIPTGKPEYEYITQGDPDTSRASDDGTRYRSQSIFGRFNYDFDSRYLLMVTMRADGSSKYQEKWGYFPSVGAAWNISNESFMKDQKWADYLKLRASWGRLGNDNVDASDGFASITTGMDASGVFGNNILPGYQNTTYFSWLKWEVVSETNVGFAYSALNSRLNVDFDYFYRLTSNAVISPLLPFSTQTLAGNYGKISNQGVDLSINWSDKVGDFSYTAGFNMSTLRNRVKDLGGPSAIFGGKTVNIVGERMNSFYGYKVIGVYQTPEQCAADPIAVANNLQPGDFIYEDVNNDGVIDGSDRQTLGSYLPSLTYGFHFGFQWKGFDFDIATYGQHGAKLFNRKRQLRYAQANYNFDHDQYANRWTGPGSTNEYPSAAALTRSWNVNSSATSTNSYFVESADFFRVQNITIGYTFRNIKMGSYTMPSLRVYANADRPFSFFSANAFSPELSDPEGWDTQVYPLSSTWTLGVQIDF